MDITPLVKSNAQVIQSYRNGSFRISGQLYGEAVLVMPESVKTWGAACGKGADALVLADFEGIDAEIVLLGTGARMLFLPAALRAALREAGLSVEVMDTAAACRTYNVLLAEGRSVCAALLPVIV